MIAFIGGGGPLALPIACCGAPFPCLLLVVVAPFPLLIACGAGPHSIGYCL